ncbi:MAG TPA: carboxypeptidase-like regulatory domain-containing protein [Candidatus Polarisedimenticolaceae bacterium]|nr:carboxypeptidase-like regulatory domain-containing protein [Candidatus Polarisedimenticolaceae bacterium]
MTSPLRIFVAALLAVSTAAAGSPAVFTGRIVGGDGVSPRAGVVVALLDLERRETYRSGPSDDGGVFRLASAPAGTYRLVAEAPEGAFVSPATVKLVAGDNRPVSVALQAEPPTPPPPPPPPPSTPPAPAPKKSGLPGWAKGTIAGAIGVAAIFVIDDVSKDEEENASQSDF